MSSLGTMDNEPYTKRELDHYFNDIKSILARQDGTLSRIETQTTKTNGRVSRLEYWRNVLIWSFGVGLTITVFLLNYFK